MHIRSDFQREYCTQINTLVINGSIRDELKRISPGNLRKLGEILIIHPPDTPMSHKYKKKYGESLATGTI